MTSRAMASTRSRTSWSDLPELVRADIEFRTGTVHRVDPITCGLNASFVARLHTDTGVIFAKGVARDRATAQRREAQVNGYVLPIAPRLRWQIEAQGWHILGFEHLDGRVADFTPGSTDLPRTARVLGQLAELQAPHRDCRRIEDRWSDVAEQAGVDIELLAGQNLLHTDLNPHNLLVTDAGTRIVDWSWPTLGAAWLDTACAALWLIAEGHSPAGAETWASTVSAWATATPQKIDAFTAINEVLWGQIAAADPCAWKRNLHTAAAAWATYRRT